jgi:LacI family transcriptional regulator
MIEEEERLVIGKRATLRTISDLTGLSQSTVSLALRGGESLRAETYKRVGEAAALVGYVPNRAGVRLRTGKTNVIALVLDRADETIDFVRFLIQGIGHGIKDTPYHLNVTPEFGPDGSIELIRNIIRNKTADGVIITHTAPRDDRIKLLLDANFPFVSHGRSEFRAGHAFHDFNSEEFIRLAMARMADAGRDNVQLVVGRDTTQNYHTIVAAFERMGADLGIKTEVLGLDADGSAREAMRELGRGIARRASRPNGIICDSELRSILLLAGLGDEGLRAGQDIHFICKQTSGLLPELHPFVDTIEEDVCAAGEELARLLIRRVAGEPPSGLQTLGEPTPHWRGQV